MKIRSVGAELFHAGGQKWRSSYSLFGISRTRLKTALRYVASFRSCTYSNL